jgi:hypothetical protein
VWLVADAPNAQVMEISEFLYQKKRPDLIQAFGIRDENDRFASRGTDRKAQAGIEISEHKSTSRTVL